jgi:hypothetical protein
VRIVVDRPLRIALTALWVSGATLAAVTAVVAIRRDAGGVGGYAGAAVALALGALFTARGHRLITTIGLVACAGQPLSRSGDGLGADARHLAHPGREAPGAGRQPEGRSRDQPRLLPMRKRSRCLGVSDAAATVRTSSIRPIVLPNTCSHGRSRMEEAVPVEARVTLGIASDRTSGVVPVARLAARARERESPVQLV